MTAQTERYLSEPGFTRLWQSARAAFERNGGLAGQALVRDLTPEEASALNGLLRRRRPLRAGGELRLPLVALDDTLRSFACPLEQWLRAHGGPLGDRPAERAGAARAEATLWAELEAAAPDDRLARLVDDLRGSGLLKRLAPGQEPALGRQALTVLARLFAAEGAPVDLAVLAASVCGDAKALNDGRPLATLVQRGLCLDTGEPTPASAAARRRLWERYGVIFDPLSSHALALNLPVEPEPGLAAAVASMTAVGEPLRLTLRSLERFPLRFRPATIYVCENPTVVSAAAQTLGVSSAPLVCSDGRPVVAVARLLEQAVAHGCTLRYHGDFDWPGIEMAAAAVDRYGAQPWRMATADYLQALAEQPAAKHLTGKPQPTPWDPPLAKAMEANGWMVEEEAVIDQLLDDLA